MKKTIAVILMLTLLASLLGCGDENISETNNTVQENIQTPDSQIEDTLQNESIESEAAEVTPENWGASARWTAGKTGKSKPFYINFPKYRGYTEGRGLVAEQVDGTMVIVASEYNKSPDLGDLKDFMPVYNGELEYTLGKIYGLISENYQFDVQKDEAVTISEHAMHMFKGKFSFDKDKEHNEYQFVVYATKLKSNGACAYWMVYDISDDQSKGDLIAEHALNMAKTFREE